VFLANVARLAKQHKLSPLVTSNDPTLIILKGKRVWIAGHRGMVESAWLRRREQEQWVVITVDRADVDLTRQDQVEAAAKVGGIVANDLAPAQFFTTNLLCRQYGLHMALLDLITLFS
jgi:hypothetical protein